MEYNKHENQYDNFKDAYNSGEIFYELIYYDKREGSSIPRITRYFKSKEKVKEIATKMLDYNKTLFERMLETYKDYGVTRDNYNDCSTWDDIIHHVQFEKLEKIDRRLFKYNETAVGFTSMDIKEIDKKKKIEEYDDFMGAYNANEIIYQVSFYDRREKYSSSRTHKYFGTEEEANKLVKEMGKYNESLIEKMLETYKDYGITKENYLENSIWNKIIHEVDFEKVDNLARRLFQFEENTVGYCFISKEERNKLKETIERNEYLEEDYADDYAESYFGKGSKPHGGAFDSYEEMYEWLL